MLSITCHQGNANQSRRRCHLTPVRRLLRKGKKAIESGGRGERGPRARLVGSQTGVAAGNSTEVPRKTKKGSHGPARPPLGVCPEETGRTSKRCLRRAQGRGRGAASCPSADGWVRARAHTHTHTITQILQRRFCGHVHKPGRHRR